MFIYPLIQQGIPGAGIESCDREVHRLGQVSDIGNAAYVDNDASDGWPLKQPLMKRRHQRRTLPTCGHVTRAEIRHRGDAGAFRDHGRISDLQAVRV